MKRMMRKKRMKGGRKRRKRKSSLRQAEQPVQAGAGAAAAAASRQVEVFEAGGTSWKPHPYTAAQTLLVPTYPISCYFHLKLLSNVNLQKYSDRPALSCKNQH